MTNDHTTSIYNQCNLTKRSTVQKLSTVNSSLGGWLQVIKMMKIFIIH